MVPIGGKPILWHIMNTFAHYHHKDFYVALGYKSEVIKEYFLKYQAINSDFQIDLSTGNICPVQNNSVDWLVSLIHTGDSSMTGGRVKRLKDYIKNETFLLTYGDGVSDIDIDKLVSFHKSHKKMITVTAVRPRARFGELNLDNGLVTSFQEKPQLEQGWINGGFFVIEPRFFDLIDGDDVMLEREPMEKAVQMGELVAYCHEGFWHCMDTKRDHDALEEMWASGEAPWISKS
jgi:glucose-1-phosphate cytidylyltransferase